MTTLQVAHQRPALRFQREQRKSWKDNPGTGTVWGQEGWPGIGATPVLPPALAGLTPMDGAYFVEVSPTAPDGEMALVYPAMTVTVLAGDGVTDNTVALTLEVGDTVYIATELSA
jgi:hypothetical protein